MTHTAEISRSNPACFLFLVDQSRSMAGHFGVDTSRTKAQGVADAINRLLQTLIYRCAKGEYILDRYHIGVIGYGGAVRPGFPIEALAGSILQPASMIAAHPLRYEDRVKRVEDGVGGMFEQRIKAPVWFEPVAQGKTPMCAALRAAHEVASGFISQHPCCFPPIVINISDGASTDGDFEPPAIALWRLASRDGNVLLFNVHLSASGQRAVLFPTDDLQLLDDYARRLFRISSPLPLPMFKQAQFLETALQDGARGFAFNADLASVLMFLDVGTRVDKTP